MPVNKVLDNKVNIKELEKALNSMSYSKALGNGGTPTDVLTFAKKSSYPRTAPVRKPPT